MESSNSQCNPVIPLIKGNAFDIGVIPEKAMKADIGCNNWEASYPYTPSVRAHLWHSGDNLFLSFDVSEKHVAALTDKDNGNVYKDSCVEFFISFDGEGYYNIESNCIGKILLSHRRSRKIDVEYASPDILKTINRVPSLGSKPFECKESEGNWRLTLKIPATSFFKHNFETLEGVKASCNLYKCGDDLPEPHFLSWKPIKTEKPDFHRPEFFGPVSFE